MTKPKYAPRSFDVQLVGRGDNAQRMNKRLACAARALGIKLNIDWQSGGYGDVLVYVNDTLFADHLLETVELEQQFKQLVDNSYPYKQVQHEQS